MQQLLLSWYRKHGRHDLPWQKNRTAYRVWVSEIMLQQTQVQTVVPYYQKFIARFSTVRKLAQVSQDEVLELWAGLGYYSRARNLHKTARIVVNEYAGRFPRERQLLEDLPGIGRSTAAAIRAQAWNLPDTILDGNVRRVMARVHAVSGWHGNTRVQKQLWTLAEACNDSEHPREYCQAVMDLGATLCRLRHPECSRCPWKKHCTAFAAGEPEAYPSKRTPRTVPVQNLSMPLIVSAGGEILLVRRPPTGIWAQMWCLPHWSGRPDYAACCRELLGVVPTDAVVELPTLSHRLTHRHLKIQPLLLRVSLQDRIVNDDNILWCKADDALNKGLPEPARKLIKTYGYDL